MVITHIILCDWMTINVLSMGTDCGTNWRHGGIHARDTRAAFADFHFAITRAVNKGCNNLSKHGDWTGRYWQITAKYHFLIYFAKFLYPLHAQTLEIGAICTLGQREKSNQIWEMFKIGENSCICPTNSDYKRIFGKLSENGNGLILTWISTAQFADRAQPPIL